MKERDYYPAGAYNDPNAPYNQTDDPERDFPVLIEVGLEKKDDLTLKYWHIEDEEGYVEDQIEDDMNERYREQRNSIPQMLELLKKYAEAELATCTDQKRKYELHDLIWDCTGWDEYDLSITERKPDRYGHVD